VEIFCRVVEHTPVLLGGGVTTKTSRIRSNREYRTPNQVEQSQKIKRTSASRRPKRREATAATKNRISNRNKEGQADMK